MQELGEPKTQGRIGQCYENARKECKARPGSSYLVGVLKYVLKTDRSNSVHSVKHAWCEDNGMVYDSTPASKGVLLKDTLKSWEYVPWAAYDWSGFTKLDGFPPGANVVQVYPAATKSVWYKSTDWRSIPKSVLKGSAMSTLKALDVTADIKDASAYTYFKLQSPKLTIHRRGKDHSFRKGDPLGWRLSSKGDNIRLISPITGPGVVFTIAITDETLRWLDKQDPKNKAKRVGMKKSDKPEDSQNSLEGYAVTNGKWFYKLTPEPTRTRLAKKRVLYTKKSDADQVVRQFRDKQLKVVEVWTKDLGKAKITSAVVTAAKDSVTLNIKAVCSSKEAALTLSNLLAAIQRNCDVGHSATVGAFFDGDGADHVQFTGLLPENEGAKMAEACGNWNDGLFAEVSAHSARAHNTTYETDEKRIYHVRSAWPAEEKDVKATAENPTMHPASEALMAEAADDVDSKLNEDTLLKAAEKLPDFDRMFESDAEAERQAKDFLTD